MWNFVELFLEFHKILFPPVNEKKMKFFVENGKVTFWYWPSGINGFLLVAFWHKWPSGIGLLVEVAFWYWPSGIFLKFFRKNNSKK